MPRPAPHCFAAWIVKLLNERGPMRWWDIYRAYTQAGYSSNYSTFPKRLAVRVRMGKFACALACGTIGTTTPPRRQHEANASNWYFTVPEDMPPFNLHDATDRKVAADWLEDQGDTSLLPTILRECTRFRLGVGNKR
jgi:hypothetical protein